MKDSCAAQIEPAVSQMNAWQLRLVVYFFLLAGGLLSLDGMINFLEATASPQILNLSDPLLRVSLRYHLFVTGTVELIVAWVCLFTRNQALGGILIVWLVVNFAVYRIGLWAAGWPHPYISVSGLTGLFNLSPKLADAITVTTCLCMLAGSGTALWLMGKVAIAGKFKKMPCPVCGGHIQFDGSNAGQKIPCPHCKTTVTLRGDENLKMSCFFCKEHIEFPAHAIGTKMACPHCKMDITLKEPV